LSFSLLQGRPDLPVEELELHGQVSAAIAAGRGEGAANAMRELIAISTRNIVMINAPRRGAGESVDMAVVQPEAQSLDP
jgi:DNA-binding FadR family transcriptional regulator